MRQRAFIVALVLALVVGTPALAAEYSLGIQSIDSADFPDVRISLTVPAEFAADGAQAAFSVTENGEKVDVLAEDHLTAPEKPVDVVLAIDTSGSMKGASLDAAKSAARAFVAAMQAPNRVAIVAFSSSARVASAFTADDAALNAAIDGLEAGGETAAYDSLVVAAGMAAEPGANLKGIVFLSDGGDTMSRTTLDEAVRQVTGAGVPVYSISLPSYEADPTVLQTIAAQTGGRQVAIEDVAALPDLYRNIAEEIQTSYVIVYRSAEPQTKDLEIEVTAVSGANSALASTFVANPRFEVRETGTGEVLKVGPADVLSLVGAVALVGFSVGLLALGLILVLVRPRTTLDQMRFYEQLRGTAAGLPSAAEATGDTLRQRMVGVVGYVAGRRGITGLVRQRLERAGLPLRPAEYMTAHITLVVVAGVAAEVVSGNLVVSAFVVVLATLAPILYLDLKARSRMTAFEEQLPQILNLIAGSLRAGWGLLQSVDMVVQETLPPASDEFQRVQTEARLGLPVEDALRSMAERVGSEDFGWAVSAIAIQREVGGNLAEVLDVVATTIRERAALRRHVSALTAEGRMSAIILLALPFVEGIVLTFVNPTYMLPLFTEPMGWMILGLGLTLLMVGSIWLVRAMRVEV
ncbi:MAG: VWA domain-containing protein [Actinobacteria bacterium]|nr:VWA domain-containing protein [Actinomycetota bacterium]